MTFSESQGHNPRGMPKKSKEKSADVSAPPEDVVEGAAEAVEPAPAAPKKGKKAAAEGVGAPADGAPKKKKKAKGAGGKGKPVVIERPAAGEGRIYWTDLVGLEVVNLQGVVLGAVQAMSNNGAHDIMEVKGDRTRLLPFVPAYVMRVDLQAKRIEVDWQADW